MAFRRKFVIEDGIEVVGDLIYHPFIYTFNEDAPTNLLGKLVIAAESKNERISVCAPKEIVQIQIDGKFAGKIDTPRETREPIEFVSTGTETIYDRQLSPRCLVINL